MTCKLTIRYDANYDAVRNAASVVRQFASSRPFSKHEVDAIELAVVEALNNVVEHAYNPDEHGTFDLAVETDQHSVQVEITDQGALAPLAFRLANARIRFDGSDPDAAPTGGMGMALIRELMDHAEYRRKGNLNVLRLTKFHSASPS
ncbi:MAG TPA: ATP-binding protein [Thermoanaerobaculia bacterium]|nr:ATP-binding protein [Thermoanaerobaculia bacterium]